MYLIEIILTSAFISAIVSGIFQWIISEKSKKNEQEIKLYGPLKFHLMMILLINKNKEDIIESDIRESGAGIETQNNLYKIHIVPLIKKLWLHFDRIMGLFERYPGFIRREHFYLVKNFVDGYMKREIIEHGANSLTNNERLDKLIDAVEALQKEMGVKV
jgi:hypothetical protein